MTGVDVHQAAYLEEAAELLTELEDALLELEESPGDMELVGRVFRALHTIKGSGAMFGFDAVASFTHRVENVFDRVRSGEIAVTPELISLTLAARDEIRRMLDSGDPGQGPGPEAEEILAGIAAFSGGEDQAPAREEGRAGPEPAPAGGRLATYRIRFIPDEDIFLTGTNPVMLLEELAALGEATVIADTGKVPPLDVIDPERCYVSWEIILTTRAGENAIRDVFIFVEDSCELAVDLVDDDLDAFDEKAHRRLGEILVERRAVSPEELKQCLARQQRIGELLVEENIVSPEEINTALAEQEHLKKVKKKQRECLEKSTIRVDAARLDGLVNLVGELVTLQARLSRKAAQERDAELISISEEADRLTAELRNNAMSMRMLPVGNTFSKFRRLVRDLSRGLGKKIVMTTEGEDTELDKTVLDKLNDPMVHLIRNCIDHGIETPEERRLAGKDEQGTVRLKAFHSGADVVLQISDDGRGLDTRAIRAKAVERGLIPADADPPDRELFSLIFAPGFSTAREVSDISGRGVGMDVVKRNIEALRGAIEIDSRRGEGTTVTLRLPLTLAIIDGLLVETGGEFFIVPLTAVEECLDLGRDAAARALERNMTVCRGQAVSYISLRRVFETGGEPPEREKVVVARVDSSLVAIGVDSVIGQHQTVIKSLGRVYQHISCLSGATILGDGSIALILDLPQLVRCAGGETDRREFQFSRERER